MTAVAFGVGSESCGFLMCKEKKGLVHVIFVPCITPAKFLY